MITALGATGFDVVVVGLGPTGATLANLLGLCGLRVLAVERFKEPYGLPRAVHFDDEVMRAFQTIGVAGEIANIVRVNFGMRFVDGMVNSCLTGLGRGTLARRDGTRATGFISPNWSGFCATPCVIVKM